MFRRCAVYGQTSVVSSRDDQFDLAGFADYARSCWRFVAIAVAVAVAAVAIAGWMLPSRYTATATIFIDPPSATAVSPVYLESLRTYEHFASSDSLFKEAIGRLHIRELYPGAPFEALKKQVLKVQKPRDTKILEISVTLSDPVKAQALAQYIAEKTVALSSSLDRENEDGQRSERLKIIDPGIVPERPSYPNRPLMIVAALLISLVFSVLYVAVAHHGRRAPY